MIKRRGTGLCGDALRPADERLLFGRAGFRAARSAAAAHVLFRQGAAARRRERAAAAERAYVESAPGEAAWWKTFHDPTLTSLAGRVADSNLDVLTATVRLGESRAQRGVAASAALPGINGNASYQRELYSKNGILSLRLPKAVRN